MGLTHKSQRYASMSSNTVRSYTELKASASFAIQPIQSHPTYHQHTIQSPSHFPALPTDRKEAAFSATQPSTPLNLNHAHTPHTNIIDTSTRVTIMKNPDDIRENQLNSIKPSSNKKLHRNRREADSHRDADKHFESTKRQ